MATTTNTLVFRRHHARLRANRARLHAEFIGLVASFGEVVDVASPSLSHPPPIPTQPSTAPDALQPSAADPPLDDAASAPRAQAQADVLPGTFAPAPAPELVTAVVVTETVVTETVVTPAVVPEPVATPEPAPAASPARRRHA